MFNLRSLRMFDEGDSVAPGEVITDPVADTDLESPGDFDPRIPEGGKVTDSGDTVVAKTELDEPAILAALAERGIKVDSLSQAQAILTDNPKLAKKHQSVTNTMKAMRAKLEREGHDPDAYLGEAVSEFGQDSLTPGKTTKRDTPANLRRYNKEQLDNFESAIKHFTGPQLDGMIEKLGPQIVQQVRSELDIRDLAEELKMGEDELTDKLIPIAKKYQIGGRNKAAFKLMHKIYTDELEGSVNSLQDNEGTPHTKKTLGTPPAIGGDRTTPTTPKVPKTDEDFRRKWEQQQKK